MINQHETPKVVYLDSQKGADMMNLLIALREQRAKKKNVCPVMWTTIKAIVVNHPEALHTYNLLVDMTGKLIHGMENANVASRQSFRGNMRELTRVLKS
ncbi:hypothetical protein ACPV5O_26470 [Vibrio maritimus]|uniref:Uncharacterized protein n=1 Tax=Vibrio chaetopteri TaxID=3016528 RepID=A0AAU8BTB3_9VIBR